MPESLIFCGRTFVASELDLMRQTAQEFSALGVTEIARTVCELLEWTRPNGGLKNYECRQLLERLQTEGFLKLPEVRKLGGRGPRRADASESGGEQVPVACPASACQPLELALVEGQAESRRWREQVARYHYLGCRVPFGAHLRYGVRHQERELACLLWTSPAWKMQARDTWIGWSDEQRRRNLQRIVNNGRFLILPWVHVKGLASKILALSARQMPRDWEVRYGCCPMLLDPGGYSAFSRDLLSGFQLDSSWANCRTRSHGPRARRARSSGQRHLRLSVGAQCAAAAMRGSHTVNKYCQFKGGFFSVCFCYLRPPSN